MSDVVELYRGMYPGEPQAQIDAAEYMQGVYADERRIYWRKSVASAVGGIASAVVLVLNSRGIIHIETPSLNTAAGTVEDIGTIGGALLGLIYYSKVRRAKRNIQEASAASEDLRTQTTTET